MPSLERGDAQCRLVVAFFLVIGPLDCSLDVTYASEGRPSNHSARTADDSQSIRAYCFPGGEADRARRYLHALASVSRFAFTSVPSFCQCLIRRTPQVMYGYEAFVFAFASVKLIPRHGWLNPLYWVAFIECVSWQCKSGSHVLRCMRRFKRLYCQV